MLDQSKKELENASGAERSAAEIVARRYLAAELEQDLISAEEAARIVDEHRKQDDETWSRALYATLMGIRAAEAKGYRIQTEA